MLEIPESNHIARQLTQIIKGKKLKNVYANSSAHRFAFFFGDPNHYHSLLVNKTVDDIQAYGGLIEMSMNDTKLVFGDGVNIRYFEQGEQLPEKHQLHIEFEDLSSIICTVQMYGGMWAFVDGENDNFYYQVAKEKPSPLVGKFDITYFESLMLTVKENACVKAFLATEQRIPGLGNGVLQDILFNARINPKRKLKTLNEIENEKLFHSIKNTLIEMIEKGGRDTEKDIFSSYGDYRTILSKKTWKNPCINCGDDIVKQTYMGGTVYYCPTCQPIL
ncbi:formamidopyrimidine-DNA glycosylase [Bacillus massiliigorillae]|uniref:formamidopyrimidine-DNA glycosylase n=1 Tax=Bacillus massiliigorillae TaxID=1243664 RepID=UPI0003A78F41|nr:formamidopyrimidine-DNA glycosylase [Bacillus massiliigorillae]